MKPFTILDSWLRVWKENIRLKRDVAVLRIENAKLKAKNETLRAALATPEIYAGLVTENLEREKREQVAVNRKVIT